MKTALFVFGAALGTLTAHAADCVAYPPVVQKICRAVRTDSGREAESSAAWERVLNAPALNCQVFSTSGSVVMRDVPFLNLKRGSADIFVLNDGVLRNRVFTQVNGALISTDTVGDQSATLRPDPEDGSIFGEVSAPSEESRFMVCQSLPSSERSVRILRAMVEIREGEIDLLFADKRMFAKCGVTRNLETQVEQIAERQFEDSVAIPPKRMIKVKKTEFYRNRRDLLERTHRKLIRETFQIQSEAGKGYVTSVEWLNMTWMEQIELSGTQEKANVTNLTLKSNVDRRGEPGFLRSELAGFLAELERRAEAGECF